MLIDDLESIKLAAESLLTRNAVFDLLIISEMIYLMRLLAIKIINNKQYMNSPIKVILHLAAFILIINAQGPRPTSPPTSSNPSLTSSTTSGGSTPINVADLTNNIKLVRPATPSTATPALVNNTSTQSVNGGQGSTTNVPTSDQIPSNTYTFSG